MKRRREQGKHHGGPAPFGTEYRDNGKRDANDRPVRAQIPVEAQRPIVQQMFADYVNGRSQLAITHSFVARARR
jgi:hypothetical protein